jgi:DNA-directed RNA polymerase specialized sigma24 family protein
VPAHFWSDSALAHAQRPLASGDAGVFAAMFDEHARHVFDYCKAILSDEVEAAGATEATFIAASSLISCLRDHDRLRPWLFALARNECISSRPGRAELAACPELPGRSEQPGLRDGPSPGYMSEPDTDALRLAAVEARIRLMEQGQAAGSLVQDPEREARVIVYRHSISPRELPAILRIPAKQAKALLAAALAGSRPAQHAADKLSFGMIRRQRPASIPDDADDADDAADRAALALPLAVPPPDVWRRAARVAIDPEFWECRDSVVDCAGQLGFDGFPADRAASLAKARARLRLVAAVTVPVVAAGGAILYVGHSSAPPSGTRPASETLHTSGTGLGNSASASPTASPTKAKRARNRGHVTAPVAPLPTGPAASKSTKPKPKPSPTPTKTATPTPTPTPSATPTPTETQTTPPPPPPTSTPPTTTPPTP